MYYCGELAQGSALPRANLGISVESNVAWVG